MVLPCLMSIFNALGGRCFGWISEEAGHLFSYGQNLDDLRTQVEDLTDAIKSLEDRIKEAESSRGTTHVDAVVDRLLERMKTLKEEASTIISNEDLASDCTCIIRLRPNLWACYRISKSAKMAIEKAATLLEKEKELDRAVAIVDLLNCSGVTPDPNYKELESRVLALNAIVEALKDPDVHRVGVYGMGGTGKTTLAKQIAAELHRNGTFSFVVLATVSEKQNNYESDLINIQEQIAGGLKVQLQGRTLNDRANQLREQLQKRDNLLIILDDIWVKFELEMVGIPVGRSFTTKFKILMTSRDKLLLENDMDSTKNFELGSLPPHDAKNLFDKMIGGEVQYSNWPLIAHQVVDLCGGIPILLVTIGRALRRANQSIWEDALTQLKLFDGQDIDKEGYKRIEVSYNFLKNEETKKLFLLCAQLDHHSIEFQVLLRYSMGLDMFKGRKTVKAVNARLEKYLRDLKGCCLLQDGNEEGIIRMHDVVHKFASFVASRDHRVFSVADGEFQDWPSKAELEDFSAISLLYHDLPPDRMLPAAFDNPKLESFVMLRWNIIVSFQMPENFFLGMKGLKLMHLAMVSLSPVLISSFSALVELRTLCLDHCQLSDISVIGELPMLQALSLVGSNIVSVPKEIGELGSTLKLLDLRHCHELKRIASGVISRLTLLEDLRIGYSFNSWERLEGSNMSNNNVDDTYEAEMASMKEFMNLRNLIHIEIHIPKYAEMFPKDLVFRKLETFTIFIGNIPHHIEYMLPRTLVIDECISAFDFDSERTKALMTRVESLWLSSVMSRASVSEMNPKGFLELKHLKVENGDKIQYIIKKNYNDCIFPKLESLDLYDLPKLEKICDDHDHPLLVRSFENLRVMNVIFCGLLKDLLSLDLARGLLHLEEINVESCFSMENIIVSRKSENEEEIEIGFTHQLQVLTLKVLPCLVSFCNFKQIEGLPSLTPLFNKKIVLPKLEKLKLIRMKIKKIWDDDLAITVEGARPFQNLTSLRLFACDNLSYLFTFSMVKMFAQLKELDILDCESMEEIVAAKEGEIEGEGSLLFPKLECIKLSDLPKLKRFCHANSLECNSLHSTNDSTFDLAANSTTLFDEKVMFPKLEVFELSFLKIEKIWDDHLAVTAEGTCRFQKLTSLEVSDCDNLRYVFNSSMAKSLAQLKQLDVNNCDSIEEIVVRRNGEMEAESLLLFPKLEVIKLGDLKSLTNFCSTSHCNLQFPSLNQVNIDNCPNMKFFSNGALSTPNLKRVWPFWASDLNMKTKEGEGRWKGDLNSTVRQLFEEKVLERCCEMRMRVFGRRHSI